MSQGDLGVNDMKSLIFFIVGFLALTGCDSSASQVERLSISAENGMNDNFDGDHSMWHIFAGQWVFTDGVIRQISTRNYYPIVLRMDQKFGDLDIRVDFKGISGRIDASGGVIFRAVDKDNYYIVRANCLENNFRLYTFKNGNRRQLASATVSPPALGEFHQIRVVAKGNHIQAYLNDVLLIDHHDTSFSKGYIGLWTKADSVTEFDHVQVDGEHCLKP